MFEMNTAKSNAGSPAASRETAAMAKSHDRPATIAMIGPSIHIKGDVSGEESLVIQGQVEGTINLKQNNLIIGQDGKVNATIHAHTITIEGNLQGDVFGGERVIVKKTGNVRGNISAPQVSMEEGAKFKGSMDMDYKPTPSPASRNDAPSAAVVKFDTSGSNDKPSINQSGDAK
jgi:cytoskeletal protein CcmA (bactofilin family)